MGFSGKHASSTAWIAGLTVAFLWASAFPAIRVAAPALGPVGLTLSRLLIASLTLIIIGLASGKLHRPRRADLPLILACGICGMAGYFLLLNWGELYVPAGTASMIVSASPIISVTVAALLLGERLSAAAIIGSSVAIIGVAVVCLARAGIALSSAVWIIVAAAVLLGVYHPLTRPLLKRYSGLEVATYATTASTLMTLPMLPFAWPQLTAAPGAAWLAALYLGMLPSAAGYALWGFSLSRLTVAVTTSFLYLVPLIAVVIGYVWLDELPLGIELAGGAVVLMGVIILNFGRFPPRRARQARAMQDAARIGGKS
ncbi:TPA: DMT family transporter [Pseudomonas putida]|nr:DMT family transporter [Pseudomonas putida]